jgi:hypothetical protein
MWLVSIIHMVAVIFDCSLSFAHHHSAHVIRCRCFDHHLVICIALLGGSMANNGRQGFRLVRATSLHPVWDGSLRVSYIRMLSAYNGALASDVRVCVKESSPREKAQLRLIYVVGWATLRERGGVFPKRSATLHVSRPGPAADRAVGILPSSPPRNTPRW